MPHLTTPRSRSIVSSSVHLRMFLRDRPLGFERKASSSRRWPSVSLSENSRSSWLTRSFLFGFSSCLSLSTSLVLSPSGESSISSILPSRLPPLFPPALPVVAEDSTIESSLVGLFKSWCIELDSIGGRSAACGGGSFSPFKIANGPKGRGLCSFCACGIGSCRCSPNESVWTSRRRRFRVCEGSSSKEEYGDRSRERRLTNAGRIGFGGGSRLCSESTAGSFFFV